MENSRITLCHFGPQGEKSKEQDTVASGRLFFYQRQASRIARHLRNSVARWQKFRPKSLKGAAEKKKLAERICGRILAEFYQKVAEKGSQKIFKRSSLFLAMITTYNVH
jgi:hypothetical protein